jgi:hypothetical protein
MAMNRQKLRKTNKSRLVLLARKSNIRGAALMKKERLVDALMKVSTRKTKAKKTASRKVTAQKVIGRIQMLPQHRLRDRVFAPGHTLGQQHHHQKAEESKFYVGPAPEYKRHEEFSFPSGYGDNKIVAMARDPWWVYAYWEIQPQKEEEVRRRITERGASPVKSILRVYDVSDVEFNGRNAHSSFDIELTGLANSWYIDVGSPDRSWVVDIGILASNSEFFVLARSNCVRTPRFGMSDVIDEEWMCAEDDYWRMFGLSGGFGIGKGSLALKEMFKKRLLQQVTSGGVSSLFSPVKKAQKKKGFWLVVDAELIVYGQTEPDAKVTVQKKPIHLRKDGTFTLRFAFPDGKQEIPVVATSNDGDDTKTITPIVTRRTE